MSQKIQYAPSGSALNFHGNKHIVGTAYHEQPWCLGTAILGRDFVTLDRSRKYGNLRLGSHEDLSLGEDETRLAV